MWRTMFSSRIVLTATHSGSDSDEIVGFCSAGRIFSTAGRSALRHVHHQADLALGGHRPLQHQHQVVHLLLLPRIGVGLLVGDEARRALQQLGDDAQVVGPQRTAGLGHLDDGVGQARRLDLGGAPAELDVGLDAVLGQPAPSSG